jgi:hypothetical protein
MSAPSRILAGAVLGYGLLSVSASINALLLAWTLGHLAWWMFHASLVRITCSTIAIGSCVLLLGLILTKVFRRLPVIGAIASMTIAVLIVIAELLYDAQLVFPALQLIWKFLAAFLLGPPAVVFLLERLRPTNRLSRLTMNY